MSPGERRLGAGERLVFRTRLHPVVFAGTAAFAAFVVGVTVLIVVRNDLARDTIVWLALAAAGIVALSFVGPLRRWRASEFAVTDRRLVLRPGPRKASVVELPLTDVRHVAVEQSLAGRLLDYGTLRVADAAEEQHFPRVAQAAAFREAALGRTRSASGGRRR